MLIRLDPTNRGMYRYEPPIEVVKTFGDIDREAPIDDQIADLLWIPAMLVCRFVFQFSFLRSEADELFSIGMMVVVDKVNNSDAPGHLIGSHVNCLATVKMEEYANSLNSIAGPTTRTRYEKIGKGILTPTHSRLTSEDRVVDDETELLVRDAAEFLGYDLENMNLNQKRKLADTLGVNWRKTK